MGAVPVVFPFAEAVGFRVIFKSPESVTNKADVIMIGRCGIPDHIRMVRFRLLCPAAVAFADAIVVCLVIQIILPIGPVVAQGFAICSTAGLADRLLGTGRLAPIVFIPSEKITTNMICTFPLMVFFIIITLVDLHRLSAFYACPSLSRPCPKYWLNRHEHRRGLHHHGFFQNDLFLSRFHRLFKPFIFADLSIILVGIGILLWLGGLIGVRVIFILYSVNVGGSRRSFFGWVILSRIGRLVRIYIVGSSRRNSFFIFSV